jgi:hypothetical protein
MANTALAEQLEKTPIGRITRLWMTAAASLRKRNGNTIAAGRDIADAVQNDLNAIKELCGDDLRALIERKAYDLARRVKEDRSDTALRGGEESQALIAGGQARRAPLPTSPNWTPEDIKPSVPQDREGVGQKCIAGGQSAGAHPSREPVDADEGLSSVAAAEAPCVVSSSASPEITGGGQLTAAQTGQTRCAVPRDARFTPGHARRGAAAIHAVQATMAKSLLDTFRVRDGRVIGNLMLRDLPDLVASNRKEAAILERVRNHSANGAPHQLVREIISDESLKRFISEAEENHAAE